MTTKQFAVLFIIVASQPYCISCDKQKASLDEIAKQLIDDIVVKVSSGIEYLRASSVLISGDATVEANKDLQHDAKLSKADKIIEAIKAGYKKVTTKHNALTQAIIDKITSDTAVTGAAENSFVKELINMVTAVQEYLLKAVLNVRDYIVGQVNIVAEDMKQHISGKGLAEKLQNNLDGMCDAVLKIVVATNIDLVKKCYLVRHDIENVAVSSHILDYMDEKMDGIIFTFLNEYVKGRVRVTKHTDTIKAVVLRMHGHH